MNEEQIKSLVDQLKAAGLEEEDIMDVFYSTFTKGKMDRKDLETLANYMGYELTDDFKNDPTPDPIESQEDGEEISKEDLEDVKEIDEDETPEEFEEKIEDIKEGESVTEDEDEDEDEDADDYDEDGDEDKEWEEAQKIFKI